MLDCFIKLTIAYNSANFNAEILSTNINYNHFSVL